MNIALRHLKIRMTRNAGQREHITTRFSKPNQECVPPEHKGAAAAEFQRV
jgi:hypothetical protein